MKKTEPVIVISLVVNLALSCCGTLTPWLLGGNSRGQMMSVAVIRVAVVVVSLMGLTVGTYRLSTRPMMYTGSGLLPFVFLFLFDAVFSLFGR
jgi:hypothetical protein